MTTRVDTEEISSTRSEKFLAVVLTIFIVIGASWLYVKCDEIAGVQRAYGYTTSEQQVLDAQNIAADRLFRAEDARESSKNNLDLARADLSLAVDRQEPTDGLETDYRAAQQTYDTALAEAKTAKTKSEVADAAAQEAEKSRSDRADNSSDWRQWLSAVLRLSLIAGLTLGGLSLVNRMRKRDSRYLPLGFAVTAGGVIMALVFAVDYITDYIDILDLGPIVLSLAGIAATVGAFVGLQKYLARRIPRSRVRKGECPFCGFPVRADACPHCEGCGREVVASCATCESPRRVGSPHCSQCGAA